jgi:glycosyltransferase involved in cell wall biosynthesis
MKIALAGTRGIPANYGGFETAVEQLAAGLSQRGHSVIVYCRSTAVDSHAGPHFPGVELRRVGGSSRQALDTLVSSVSTGADLWRSRKDLDVVVWFNAANVPGILISKVARIPVVLNPDGEEWRRRKWGPFARAYSLIATFLGIQLATLVVGDSRRMVQILKQWTFRRVTFIPYGHPRSSVLPSLNSIEVESTVLADFGVEPGKFVLQITRVEPDNTVLEGVASFLKSELPSKGYKFIVVGFKGTSNYERLLLALAGPNVILSPPCYDGSKLSALRSAAAVYFHGNSVGGTNPALLEAMGYSERILSLDTPHNREVLRPGGVFAKVDDLPAAMNRIVEQSGHAAEWRRTLDAHYTWSKVVESYAEVINSARGVR